MKRQRGFDWFKFVTISMVVIGVGFFLISLILPRYIWRDEELGLEKKEMDGVTTFQPSNPVASTGAINNSQEQPETDKEGDELMALLEPKAEKKAERNPRGKMEDSSKSESSEHDSSENRVNQEEVEAVVARIYDNAEKFRRILIRNTDLASGRYHLYPEAFSDPERSEESRRFEIFRFAQDEKSNFITVRRITQFLGLY